MVEIQKLRRVNITLLEEQDRFVSQYQKENNFNLDEAINSIIKELKDILTAKGKKDGKGKSDK
jgi:hypothetical protein